MRSLSSVTGADPRTRTLHELAASGHSLVVHDEKPGRPAWFPGARHVRNGGALAFDHRCKLCSYELGDFIVRRRPPSQLVLAYLRELDKEA